MATLFMDAGTSATGGTEFYTTGTGSVTSQTTTHNSNPRALKCDTGAGNARAYAYTSASTTDSGRLSFWVNFSTATPAAVGQFAMVTPNSITASFGLRLSTAGKLQLFNTSNALGSQIGSTGTATLSANTWYRICIVWTITNTTTFTIKVFLEVAGIVTTDVTASSGTLGWGVGVGLGWSNASALPGASTQVYFDGILYDNSSNLVDFGAGTNVTCKLPAALNTNNFDTLGGSGTNRYDRVSDSPLSETNYIEHAASTDVQENFGLQTASQGDVSISGATLISRQAWIWAKRGSAAGSISFRTAHSANANNVAITTPASGDLIVVMAYNNASTTVPTLNGSYTNIGTQSTGGSSNAARLAWRTSDGTETGSGTWTNATNVVVQIFRGTGGCTVGASTPTAGNSATLTYGTLSMTISDGSSWVAGFGAARAATAGMNLTTTVLDNNNTNQTTVAGLDTHNGVSSYSAETRTVTTSGRWYTWTLEIVATAVSVGTPKIMDNGTETAVTLTTTSALYSVITDSATYPSNVAGIGMRSSNAAPTTFLYECGTMIAYIPGTGVFIAHSPFFFGQAINRTATY